MNKGEIALITTTDIATPQALTAARTLEVTLRSKVRINRKSSPKGLLFTLTPFFRFRHVEQPLDLPGTPTMVTESVSTVK
jgi:hypothetical protein